MQTERQNISGSQIEGSKNCPALLHSGSTVSVVIVMDRLTDSYFTVVAPSEHLARMRPWVTRHWLCLVSTSELSRTTRGRLRRKYIQNNAKRIEWQRLQLKGGQLRKKKPRMTCVLTWWFYQLHHPDSIHFCFIKRNFHGILIFCLGQLVPIFTWLYWNVGAYKSAKTFWDDLLLSKFKRPQTHTHTHENTLSIPIVRELYECKHRVTYRPFQ